MLQEDVESYGNQLASGDPVFNYLHLPDGLNHVSMLRQINDKIFDFVDYDNF